jgi:hypothetical protein
MNFNKLLGRSPLLLTSFFVLHVLISCAEDEQPKPDPTPEPKPDSVITITVPEIAPLICDFNHNDDSLADGGWTKVFEDDFTGDLSNSQTGMCGPEAHSIMSFNFTRSLI